MRVFLLAVLLVIASTPAHAADKPVLRYEGKPLADWVTRFQKADSAEQRAAATQAIVAFGANAAPAVPALIEMLSDLSPMFRNEVINLLGDLGPIAKDARPVILTLRREKKMSFVGTARAYVALFPKPKDAISDLLPYLDDPEDDSWVYSALCEMGPDAKDAIPAMRQYVLKLLAAAEKDKEKSLCDLHDLSKLGPDVVPLLVELLGAHSGRAREHALGCLEELGPKAIKAVPALLALLKHDDLEVRFRVAKVLWKVEKSPAVVTALAGLLGADANIGGVHYHRPARKITFYPLAYLTVNSTLASDIAKALGEMGSEAKDALPALRDAVAIGLPASILSNMCFPLDRYDISRTRAANRESAASKLATRYSSLVTVAQAAVEAIDKIEGRTKK